MNVKPWSGQEDITCPDCHMWLPVMETTAERIDREGAVVITCWWCQTSFILGDTGGATGDERPNMEIIP